MSSARNTAKRGATSVESTVKCDENASYASLPKKITNWPQTYARNGKTGLSSPSRWLELNGEEMGIRSLNELRARAQDGSIPAIPMAKVGDALGGLTLVDKASDLVVLPNDPGTVRADPGKLHPVVAVHTGRSVSLIAPDDITLTLYVDATTRGEAYKRLREIVANVAKDEVVRVAWVTSDNKVRVVDYITADGERIIPDNDSDLECMVDGETVYSSDDLVADVLVSLRAPTPTRATTQATIAPPPSAKPSSLLASRPGATPVFAVPTQSDLFAASREAVKGGPRPPTDHSHHIVVVAARLQDLNRKMVDGAALIHAGIISSYGPMLAAGVAQSGRMDATSRLFFAERTGDTCTIMAMAPYVGLRQNTSAANLIVPSGTVESCQRVEFSLANLGMNVPTLPFVIGRSIDLNGFHIPAAARQQIWLAIHTANGWPTEPQVTK